MKKIKDFETKRGLRRFAQTIREAQPDIFFTRNLIISKFANKEMVSSYLNRPKKADDAWL